jgi:hypothetical protein
MHGFAPAFPSLTYTTGVEKDCLKDNSTFATENASAELSVASSVFSRYAIVGFGNYVSYWQGFTWKRREWRGR